MAKKKQEQQPEAIEPVDEAAEKEKKRKASQTTAQLMTRPSFMAAHTAMSFVPNSMRAYGEPRVFEMWEEHQDGIKKVAVEGDMTLPESMLMGQAMSLNSIYNWCAELAGANVDKSLPQAEILMRMALKAQAQCTQTLRVLGELKNPRAPATFVKQANIANGNQQVNNATVTQGAATHAHTENETPTPTNELLSDNRKEQHEQTLDTRGKGRAGEGDQGLETVGEVDRPAHRSGEGHRVAECV